jgi:hypothetical protein
VPSEYSKMMIICFYAEDYDNISIEGDSDEEESDEEHREMPNFRPNFALLITYDQHITRSKQRRVKREIAMRISTKFYKIKWCQGMSSIG